MTREELNQEKQKEILSEERYEKRKKITIFIFKILVIIVISFIAFYLYTSNVSSKLVNVKEERIVDKNLPNNFSGLKIIQFSDLHYGTTFFYDDLVNLVKKINKRNPDLVLFTGDLVDENYKLSTDEKEKIIAELKKIKTTLGKYAVFGDEDKEVFNIIMKQSDFQILENNYEFIYRNDLKPIVLIGLQSNPNNNEISKAFEFENNNDNNASNDFYSIVIGHEPDIIDRVLKKHHTNLYLAGHSLNGTIRLPFIGGLYKPNGAKKYYDEYYNVNGTKLFISGGIGTDKPGFRLFCRPSFNFFRISNR